MGIKVAYSFLVHPGKNLDDQPPIAGTKVELTGKLFTMLDGIYQKAPDECNIDIAFLPNDDGEQQNDCRDLVLGYLQSRTEQAGRKLAESLQAVTTHRSGMGLLFLMIGEENTQARLVISRFPADSGILAEQIAKTLNVQFLEKIFMKSATSYKSAVYSGTSPDSDFWYGRAIDKQIDTQKVALSDYWIKDFLMSDFRTTAAAGTRRLATALKAVVKNTSNVDVKDQVAAAARLTTAMNGRRTSIAAFARQLNLSLEAQQELQQQLPKAELFTEKFVFDVTEFKRHLAYRSIELNNGAVLTAEAADFDNVFTHERLAADQIRYSTQGKIVNQRLKPTK